MTGMQETGDGREGRWKSGGDVLVQCCAYLPITVRISSVLASGMNSSLLMTG